MKIIETRWPEVTGRLAPYLTEDRYVRCHLRQADPVDCFVVAGSHAAEDVMRTYAHDPTVWLEAHTEKARELLRTLPAGRESSVLVGTALGLRLVQQEMSGTVSPAGVFCVLERRRFRPVKKHGVRKLEKADRSALESYPEQRDLEVTLRCFDENSEGFYGCLENGRLIGYAVASRDFSLCVHVRPEFRGQGYGSSLLSAAAEEVLNKDGVALFDAETTRDMAELRLALAVGFVPHREQFWFQGKR